MNASEALGRLKSLRVPAATTADVAAVLGLSSTATSHMLNRLGRAGLVTPLRKGVWALAERPDRLALAEYVTAPYPAYLSLQTALYQHGMIEQIPSMIYLVSLARSARVDTALGTYSLHHVQAAFFDGSRGFRTRVSSSHCRRRRWSTFSTSRQRADGFSRRCPSSSCRGDSGGVRRGNGCGTSSRSACAPSWRDASTPFWREHPGQSASVEGDQVGGPMVLRRGRRPAYRVRLPHARVRQPRSSGAAPRRPPMALYKLTYFDAAASRGDECRLALHVAGLSFEDERLNRDQWTLRKASTPFGALPVLTAHGRPLPQSNAILRFIGSPPGLHPCEPVWPRPRP